MYGDVFDDRYELRGRIGGGGMADVYLALDRVLDREVALKLLKARYSDDEEFVERFKREAQSAAALSHPNIVSIFDRGEDDAGTYYIAMEYLPGGTLKDRMPARGVLPVRTSAAVALQVAEALGAAHARRVIHRDVKPRNILVAASGDVKVGDFGIARAADATTISALGSILGTAQYMSPEQAEGRPVGPRSDLYSLGVVIYEMFTGEIPFEVEEPADVSAAHSQGPPPRPSERNPEVSTATDALVMRLLATDPMRRCENAEEVVRALSWAWDEVPPLSAGASSEKTTVGLPDAVPLARLPSPSGPSAGIEPGGGRRKTPIVVAAFVLVALLGVIGWEVWRGPGEGMLSGVSGWLREAPPELVDPNQPGPGEARVPEVAGLPEQQARDRLSDAGFEVRARPREGTAEETGTVLEQAPLGGRAAEKNSEVTILVAEAPPGSQPETPVEGRVPDLAGLSFPEAENALAEAGLLLGGVTEEPSETEPAGTILSQDPAAGTELEPGSFVYLTTSTGPEQY